MVHAKQAFAIAIFVVSFAFLIEQSDAQALSPTPAPVAATNNTEPPPSAIQPTSQAGSGLTPPHEGESVVLENADLMTLDENNKADVRGHVRVKFREYTLYADHAVIDTKTGAAQFDGNVHLVSDSQNTSIISDTHTGSLFLDLHDGSYALNGPERAIISPDLLNGSGLALPLFVGSTSLTSANGFIDARSAGFTTCDFAHPHYSFGVRQLTIVPGKHLIGRHVTLFRRGKRILEIQRLVLPLNNRYSNQGYLPTVGQSVQEGYFAKFAVPYALTAVALGVIRLDLLQKEGVGTGVDQNYHAHGSSSDSTLSLYRLDDQSTGLTNLTNSLTHRQTIGDFNLNINSNYQEDSYYISSGKSQSLSTSILLNRVTQAETTSLTTNIQQASFGDSLSRNLTSSLSQTQNLGKNSSVDLKLDFAGYSSPGFLGTSSTQTSTLGTSVGMHFQPSGLKVDVLTNFSNTLQSTGISGGLASNDFGLQRVPELTLTTTGYGGDILDRVAEKIKGSQLQFVIGSYKESSTNTNGTRTYYSYDLGNQNGHIGLIKTTAEAAYQQAFYSDGAARYSLNGHYLTSYKTGAFLLGANYTTLRAFGYTPFVFDRTSLNNSAVFNAGYDPNKSLNVTLATAYDFLRDRSEFGQPATPWQNLLTIADYHPSSSLTNHTQSTYDLNHGRIYDIANTFTAGNPNGFQFNTSADYSPITYKFGAINGSLNMPIILDQHEQAGYKITALAGYNGYTGKYTYRGFSLTRTWHDWEMTSTFEDNPSGYPPGKSFYFTFHLKAFPGVQPLGIGNGGQSLIAGSGQVF